MKKTQKPDSHTLIGVIFAIFAFFTYCGLFWGGADLYTIIVGLLTMAIPFTVLSCLFLTGTIFKISLRQKNLDDFNGVAASQYNVNGESEADNTSKIDIDFIFTVDGMEGHKFEYYCANLLRSNGFTEVTVTQASGDQGVDILATKDNVKYAIQCKNYSSNLGNTPIQEVYAGKVFYNCHVGVVMTNAEFTDSAKDLAKATGVLLWDRSVLKQMISTARQNSARFSKRAIR